jgi:hypothetical protein
MLRGHFADPKIEPTFETMGDPLHRLIRYVHTGSIQIFILCISARHAPGIILPKCL